MKNNLQATTQSGTVLGHGNKRMAYTAHGYPRSVSDLKGLGYNGQLHEPVAGMQALGNGFRAYSPTLGRFLRPDSVSPFGKGGLNSYAYAQAEPVNRVDSSGQSFAGIFSQIWSQLGASVGRVNKSALPSLQATVLAPGFVAGITRQGTAELIMHGVPGHSLVGNVLMSPRETLSYMANFPAAREILRESKQVHLFSCFSANTGYVGHMDNLLSGLPPEVGQDVRNALLGNIARTGWSGRVESSVAEAFRAELRQPVRGYIGPAYNWSSADPLHDLSYRLNSEQWGRFFFTTHSVFPADLPSSGRFNYPVDFGDVRRPF